MNEQPNPIARLLARLGAIEQDELPAVITAFLLYFCVLGGYFAVRPVRETVGTILGDQTVANLWTITAIVSVALVPVYGALCAKYRRSTFLPWIYGFVAIALVVCSFAVRGEGGFIGKGFFYVLISVVNLFVVSVFYSFLLELFNAVQTKRLFGTIAAGGTAGALVGPMLTDLFVGTIGDPGVMLVGAGMFTIAILLQRTLLGIGARHNWSEGPRALDRPIGGNPFAGFTLILKSPYLLGIALFVVLLASVTTFLYFQQLRIVAETFADREARTRVFARIDYVVQSLTILIQIVFTGRLATRFGVGALLTGVPIIMVTGFLFLAGFHTFAVLAAVMIARRVGEYSLVRPGREMLFSRVDTETKYKAKMTIDVPVYRGADAVAAQVEGAVVRGGVPLAGVALIGAAIASAWAVTGYVLGRSKGEPAMERTPVEV